MQLLYIKKSKNRKNLNFPLSCYRTLCYNKCERKLKVKFPFYMELASAYADASSLYYEIKMVSGTLYIKHRNEARYNSYNIMKDKDERK